MSGNEGYKSKDKSTPNYKTNPNGDLVHMGWDASSCGVEPHTIKLRIFLQKHGYGEGENPTYKYVHITPKTTTFLCIFHSFLS